VPLPGDYFAFFVFQRIELTAAEVRFIANLVVDIVELVQLLRQFANKPLLKRHNRGIIQCDEEIRPFDVYTHTVDIIVLMTWEQCVPEGIVGLAEKRDFANDPRRAHFRRKSLKRIK